MLRSSFVRTGLMLIALPVAFQVGTVLLLLRVQSHAEDADAWALHSKRVLAEAQEATRQLTEAHSAARGVALFGDPDLEQPQRDALAGFPRQIANLRALVGDNQNQLTQLDRVAAAAEPYLAWSQRITSLARSHDWAAYREEFLSYRGKRLVEAVDRELDVFTAEEERLDRERVATAAAARRLQRRLLVAAVVVSIAIAVLVVVVFARVISVRLERVTANARRLAVGEPLAPPLAPGDDIAVLDAVLHDSADRLRAAADAKRALVAELAHERDTLSRANSELAFKTQENEMFVYSVSHDLRTPLVNLQGFTDELGHGCGALQQAIDRLDLPTPDRQQIQRVLEGDMRTAMDFIRNAVSRLAAIVDALLRLSRAGRVQYHRSVVELKPIVDRVLRSLQITVRETGARVEVQPLPAVWGDSTAIEQVFQNLIANALQYLDPDRPGSIEIGTRPRGDDDPPDMVTVFVRDNGRGIAAGHQSKLFVPFERLHGDAVKGEGIGLALVKRVIERHGGRIWVESAERRGTTVFAQLPSAPAQSPQAATDFRTDIAPARSM